MKKEQILKIIEECNLPDTCSNVELAETHISWIILSDNFAFKIKKPVKFNFLDFSDREKRKYYCRKEVVLNSRIDSDIYHGIEEVITLSDDYYIDNNQPGETIDHAVKMTRLNGEMQMNKLLEKDAIQSVQIEQLAEKVADFHKRTTIIKKNLEKDALRKKYNDIETEKEILEVNGNKRKKEIIEQAVEASNDFLDKRFDIIQQRCVNGYRRDCHGDLHSRNIFIRDEPVIFDCVEFNDSFREIDVLNDIAFFCMDLDFWGKEELSEAFYTLYHKNFGTEDDEETREIFNYYKSYRANVRSKVAALKAEEMEDGAGKDKKLEESKKYLQLMENYLEKLNI